MSLICVLFFSKTLMPVSATPWRSVPQQSSSPVATVGRSLSAPCSSGSTRSHTAPCDPSPVRCAAAPSHSRKHSTSTARCTSASRTASARFAVCSFSHAAVTLPIYVATKTMRPYRWGWMRDSWLCWRRREGARSPKKERRRRKRRKRWNTKT